AMGLGARYTVSSLGSLPAATHRRVRAGRDQVGHRVAWVLAGHQGFADQYRVRAAVGVGDQVVRATHAGLGDAHDVVRNQRGEAGEGGAVDLERAQVARV